MLLLLLSCSVMSDSLRPHGLPHTRLPCPSPSPGTFSNSCPSSQWCHGCISSSVIPFSSCLHSFLASGSFLISWLFASCSQSIEASGSASALPVEIQSWFPLGSPYSPRDSSEYSLTPQFKSIRSSSLSLLYGPTLTSIHDYWKNHNFAYTDFCQQSNISAF